MRNVLRMILLMFVFNMVQGESFVEIEYLDRGIFGSNKYMGPQITDYNRNGKEEFTIGQYNKINFYEYDEDSNFILINEFQLDSTNLLWTAGIGDMDGDGLLEMLLRNPEINTIFIYEQSDSTSFFNTLTWISDTIYKSLRYLGITNKLKGDGTDRIYGGGIPEITTPTNGYGWYYFTCTGDNQYEILNTFEESTRVYSTMNIGYLDNDSLIDVVILTEPNVNIYEEIDTSSDSFDLIFARDTDYARNPLATLILPDIDRDGRNEYIQYCLNYLGPPNSYGYAIMEDTSGTGVYDTIWRRDFEVETDYSLVYAGDMDYGDVDGDSINELVICGGRHVEVWESTGDNQFEMMWEYTDPTYKTIQSHIKCHDFNKNGYDEIIFSGCGQSVGDECTRIFEDSVAVNGIEESHEPCAVRNEPNSGTALVLSQTQITWNTNTQGTLTVYDMSGREVIREETTKSRTHKTDIRHLKNGIYFIKLNNPNQTITKKLVRIK